MRTEIFVCSLSVYRNYIILISIVTTVNFEQSTYNVHEPDGSVQPAIVFSNRLSYNITVQVSGECEDQ